MRELLLEGEEWEFERILAGYEKNGKSFTNIALALKSDLGKLGIACDWTVMDHTLYRDDGPIRYTTLRCVFM